MARQPRVKVPTMRGYMQQRADRNRTPVNRQMHEQLHGPVTLVYTTTKTLNTTAGPRLRLPSAGYITRVSGKVQAAPTSTMEIDILVDGITVFDSGDYVKIRSGETVTVPKIINRPNFNEDSYFQVQVVTIAAATGPLVLTIEYIPGPQ